MINAIFLKNNENAGLIYLKAAVRNYGVYWNMTLET
tara:strand:- start:305 stop:412 length:108 start_codon:yes stop_codon:yes gene_type:complete